MKITPVILTMLVYAGLLMGSSQPQELYTKKCVSCHGSNGEKKALGISKIINTLTEEEIGNALRGYKNGTYGGKYKTLKSGMIRSLSEEQINGLSVYIQTFRSQQ